MLNRRPDINNLFLPHYIESIREDPFCKEKPETAQTLISMSIITDCMGLDFVARNFEGRIGGHECPREDFYKKIDGTDTLLFANALWETKNCVGWKNTVVGNRRRNPRAFFTEMQFALLLMKSSATVEFVKPKNKRGFDFDLRCKEHNEFGDIDIEVKNRVPVFRSVVYCKDYLSGFRDQIAGEGNKALLINLDCENFTSDDQEILDKAIQDTLEEWTDYSFIAYSHTVNKTLEDGRRMSAILTGGRDRNGKRPKIVLSPGELKLFS